MSEEIGNEDLDETEQPSINSQVGDMAIGADLRLDAECNNTNSVHGNSFTMEVQEEEEEAEATSDQPSEGSPAGQGMAVLDSSSLQSLLAQMQGGGVVNTEGIQVITLNTSSDLAAFTQATLGTKFVQVMPTTGDQQLPVLTFDLSSQSGAQQESQSADRNNDLISTSRGELTMSTILQMPPLPPIQKLPPGCPTWAARLRDCEQIGDSFRGWVETEVELDLLLTYHKQQTQSLWGTRQSPSPGKPSTRLMWKSQYVPFDGVPFVNSGSRAIVMECQYGPRRKGIQAKKNPEILAREFKQTCPARIYIKKVRKFPSHAVDINADKKDLKNAMERAFVELRQQGTEGWGQERYYVQLPTEKAHEFHGEQPTLQIEEPDNLPRRLHPKVAQKVRDMVSSGETRLYAIRKALRRYVERELFAGPDDVPERHNLAYFPTVHDLQNHIYQAVKDIEHGVLPLKSQLMNSVIGTSINSIQEIEAASLWPHASSEGGARAETVTVTLTQNSGEDGSHVISKVETHLSDGSTQVSSTLAPETAQLLSKLHPHMFPNAALVQLSTSQPQLISVVAASGQKFISESETESDAKDLTETSDSSPIISNANLVTTAAEQSDLSGLVMPDPSTYDNNVKIERDLLDDRISGGHSDALDDHTADLTQEHDDHLNTGDGPDFDAEQEPGEIVRNSGMDISTSVSNTNLMGDSHLDLNSSEQLVTFAVSGMSLPNVCSK